MKFLYKFTLDKKEQVEEIAVSLNENNEEVQVKKKVEKLIPQKFFIRKPNRSSYDDAEIFYAKTLSNYIQQGVISANQLQKRFNDDGGVLSKQESAEYESLYKLAFEKQSKINELKKVEEKDRTADQTTELEVITNELVDIFKQIQKFDNSKNSLYSNTAEVLARNKLLSFWTLMLSYKEKDGKEVPVFGDGSYEEKLKTYDKIEEDENEFEYAMIKRLLLAVSLWHFGKCETQDEFDSLVALSENESISNLLK